MNWLGVIAVLLGFVTFAVGKQIARKSSSRTTDLLLSGFGMLLALPAIFYSLYYSK